MPARCSTTWYPWLVADGSSRSPWQCSMLRPDQLALIARISLARRRWSMTACHSRVSLSAQFSVVAATLRWSTVWRGQARYRADAAADAPMKLPADSG